MRPPASRIRSTPGRGGNRVGTRNARQAADLAVVVDVPPPVGRRARLVVGQPGARSATFAAIPRAAVEVALDRGQAGHHRRHGRELCGHHLLHLRRRHVQFRLRKHGTRPAGVGETPPKPACSSGTWRRAARSIISGGSCRAARRRRCSSGRSGAAWAGSGHDRLEVAHHPFARGSLGGQAERQRRDDERQLRGSAPS